MLFSIVLLLPILALASASPNIAKRFEGNKQIRLASTGKCLNDTRIEIGKEDATTLSPKFNKSGMIFHGFGLADCKDGTNFKVFPGGSKEIRMVENDDKRITYLDAGPFFDEEPDNIILEQFGPSERPVEQWELTDQGRLSIVTDKNPKYCLSRINHPSIYIRTAVCDTVPVEEEGDIKQIWEITDPVNDSE